MPKRQEENAVMKTVAALLAALLLAPAAWAQTTPQKQWDDVLAAARREGKVVVVGSPDPVMRNKVIPAFTARYGVQVAYIAGGSGELVGRFRVERSSGMYSVDVYMAGNDTTANTLYPEKMIDPLKPLMILPETVDPVKWKEGKLRFIDPEGQRILQLFNSVNDILFFNSDYVKPEEMQSVDDLLNPKWKGKISTEDPSVSGAGSNRAVRFYVDVGPEFTKKLYVDQKPLVSRDRRLLSDALARGSHPICITCRVDDVEELRKAGYKLTDIFELKGMPQRVRPGPFLLTVANNRPNPNAAQVFVNWMASKEALEIYAANYGEVTLRTDVDESSLDPRIVPKPDVTYHDDGAYDWIVSTRRDATKKMQVMLKPN
jgi:iron(III) transport system substrate-binding protein